MNYDVIIVGAGPGGIYSAYELMKRKIRKRPSREKEVSVDIWNLVTV